MKEIFEEKFNRIIIVATAALSLLILIFIILNSFTNLHTRKFTLVGTRYEAALQNQKVNIQFNRPLDDKQSLDSIKITPEAEYSARVTGSNLLISFASNLDSATDYTIALPADLKDIYGQEAKKTSEVKFKTKELAIVYLERNSSGEDRIMRVDGSLENQAELYKSPRILKFAKEDNYLAVIKQEGTSELKSLYLVNLKNKTEERLFDDTKDIHAVGFAPKSDELFVIAQSVEIREGYVVPNEGRKVEIYNTKKEEYYPFDLGSQIADVDEFKFSPNGGSILVKETNNAFYYLAPVSNSQSLNAIGRFVLSGGFNPKGDKLIFSNIDLVDLFSEPFIVLVDSNREKKQLTEKSIYSLDPIFFNKQEILAYSLRYQEREDSRGLFKLAITDLNNKLIEEAQIDGMSVELPKPSPDDKYIVMESYTPEALADYENQRSFSFQAKPYEAEIVVYDVEKNTFLDKDIKGIEAIWD